MLLPQFSQMLSAMLSPIPQPLRSMLWDSS